MPRHEPLPAASPTHDVVGKLLHDLTGSPSAAAGAWATIEYWEPDPAWNAIDNATPADVLPLTAVTANSFAVAGDHTSDLHQMFPIAITGSTDKKNDGKYLLDAEPTFTGGTTTITISGSVPDPTITTGNLVIIRPPRLKATGRKDRVVIRAAIFAAAGTFVKATNNGWEMLIDVVNCEVE